MLGLTVLANAQNSRKTRVACIGNSITYGLTLADPAKESYPAQLQSLLSDKNYEVANFGKSGTTLLRHGHRPYVEQEEWTKAKAFNPDIAVIHLGVNDTDPRNWPYFRDEFIPDYLAIIDTLRQNNPQCRIIIARLTPITYQHARFESGTRDWEKQIQDAIETVARVAKAELIDFHKPLYAYPQLLPDAVHPNKEGARILAKTVYSAIVGDYGGLSMPVTYTDNMVLQRNRNICISGTANSGDIVRVELIKSAKQPKSNGRRLVKAKKIVVAQAETTVNNRGEWSLCLPPQPASTGLTLVIHSSDKTLSYNNVACGEVWLCSGQSNMEFTLKEAATASRDIPLANYPDLRLFDMKARWQTYPVEWDESALDSINHLQYYKMNGWKPCTPDNARDFSAVAYYFGRVLQDSLNIPIGLICNAVGGSPTEAWVSRDTIEQCIPHILSNWTGNDYVQQWVRERGALNIKKASDANRQRHPYQPCYLYEAGIEPLKCFPIKGVIWYQGESNAQYGELHNRLFKMLVGSWRNNWGDKDLPFYYVQLSSLDRKPWQWFRDSQRRLLGEMNNVAMAVSSDVGDSLNVHPTRKQPVGERLARIALHNDYGYKDVCISGPLISRAKAEKNATRLYFDYASGLTTSDGKSPRTFEIAEEEGCYKPAKAVIEGENILLSSPEVNTPRWVRYGWQPYTNANLVNKEGLPASTFRIEIEK